MSHEKAREIAAGAKKLVRNTHDAIAVEEFVLRHVADALSALVPDEVAGAEPVAELVSNLHRYVKDGYYKGCELDIGLAADTITALAARAEKAEREQDIWPEWAAGIYKCLRDYGVEPGDEEGWDLPAQFEDWIRGVVENETARISTLEAELSALRARLEEAGRVIVGLLPESPRDIVNGTRPSFEQCEDARRFLEETK